jgi:hypothetical protein
VPLDLFNAVLLDLSGLRSHRKDDDLRSLDRRIHEFDQCRYTSPVSATQRMPTDALPMAVLFHEVYERLAPQFGYETRPETRQFDPQSKNGRLMVAVCAEILQYQAPQPATATIEEFQRVFREERVKQVYYDNYDDQSRQVPIATWEIHFTDATVKVLSGKAPLSEKPATARSEHTVLADELERFAEGDKTVIVSPQYARKVAAALRSETADIAWLEDELVEVMRIVSPRERTRDEDAIDHAMLVSGIRRMMEADTERYEALLTRWHKRHDGNDQGTGGAR